MAECKKCGAKIVFAFLMNESGRNVLNKKGNPTIVPLDPKPPVYSVSQNDPYAPEDADKVCVRDKSSMVSHFITCPNANDFSGSNKK